MSTKKSELEEEFSQYCSIIQKQIQAKVDEAKKILQEAVAISESTGVPFKSEISMMYQGYSPRSFKVSKYKVLGEEVIERASNVYMNEGNHDGWGWEQSALC